MKVTRNSYARQHGLTYGGARRRLNRMVALGSAKLYHSKVSGTGALVYELPDPGLVLGQCRECFGINRHETSCARGMELQYGDRACIPVLVYGSLKKGFGNHRVLSEGGRAEYVRDDSFPATMRDLGTFPAIEKTNPQSIVRGEVYHVNARCLMRLDQLEGNGRFYERSLTALDSGAEAWVYWIKDEAQIASRPIVASGVWERAAYR